MGVVVVVVEMGRVGSFGRRRMMTLGNTDGHGTMDSFRKKKIWRLLRGGFFFGLGVVEGGFLCRFN